MHLRRDRGDGRTGDPVGVLVVCTGNVCRSPYIAARLGAALPELRVWSAGTAALRGEQPTSPVLGLLADRGVPPPRQVARSLDRALVRGADLILTAERRHRVEVARLVPKAADRTFTLLEISRLLAPRRPWPVHGLEAVVCRARRSLEAGADRRDHDDDLADPYGLAADAYGQMADIADAALQIIVPALRVGATL